MQVLWKILCGSQTRSTQNELKDTAHPSYFPDLASGISSAFLNWKLNWQHLGNKNITENIIEIRATMKKAYFHIPTCMLEYQWLVANW